MMRNPLLLPSFWLENTPYNWDSLELEGIMTQYKKGEILFLEGDTMQTVYLIKQGKVKLSITNKDGNEKTVGYLGNNSIVGTSSLFNDAKYMFNATVISKSNLFKFDRDQFIQKVLKNDVLTQQILKIMSMRIRMLTAHVLDLSFHHSFHRLAKVLIEVSDTYGKPLPDGSIFIDFKITQREFSEIIGTTLVTVSNHLKKLIELGIIQKQQQHYIILDMPALIDITKTKNI